MRDTARMSESINIGVADLYFTPEGTEVPIYLGLTKGGIEITYTPDWHELTSDQTGNIPLDDVQIGETVVVEGSILDTSKRKIGILFPTATAVGNNENISAVTFGSRPGRRATHSSGKLVIHPVSMGAGDRSMDVIIYRTTNTGNLELAYKLDEEWVIACQFKGYYDDERSDGDRLFRIGEDSGGGSNKVITLFWLTPSNPEVEVGTVIEFRANAMFEDGTTEDVTDRCKWVSSAPQTVSLALGTGNNGRPVQRATALSSGSTVIRAEFIGYSNSTSMVVS